jgi:dsRNA-specific ribonuclease
VRSIKTGHSRLAFLGEYVLELALAEFFLMRYPRESPACLRERIFGLINKKALPRWIRIACLDGAIYPEHSDVRTEARLQNIR